MPWPVLLRHAHVPQHALVKKIKCDMYVLNMHSVRSGIQNISWKFTNEYKLKIDDSNTSVTQGYEITASG